MPSRRKRAQTLEEAFGLVVARLRQERDLSTERLGNEADIDPSYVRLLESGKRSPSLRTLRKLGDVFELTPSELLERAERLLEE